MRTMPIAALLLAASPAACGDDSEDDLEEAEESGVEATEETRAEMQVEPEAARAASATVAP